MRSAGCWLLSQCIAKDGVINCPKDPYAGLQFCNECNRALVRARDTGTVAKHQNSKNCKTDAAKSKAKAEAKNIVAAPSGSSKPLISAFGPQLLDGLNLSILRWLMITHQPLSTIDSPQFKEMIRSATALQTSSLKHMGRFDLDKRILSEEALDMNEEQATYIADCVRQEQLKHQGKYDEINRRFKALDKKLQQTHCQIKARSVLKNSRKRDWYPGVIMGNSMDANQKIVPYMYCVNFDGSRYWYCTIVEYCYWG